MKKNFILIEETTLKDEISNIVETYVELSNDKSILVRHTIQGTMIDVHTVLSVLTSSMLCLLVNIHKNVGVHQKVSIHIRVALSCIEISESENVAPPNP